MHSRYECPGVLRAAAILSPGFVQYVLFVSERPCDSDVATSRVQSLAIHRPGA